MDDQERKSLDTAIKDQDNSQMDSVYVKRTRKGSSDSDRSVMSNDSVLSANFNKKESKSIDPKLKQIANNMKKDIKQLSKSEQKIKELGSRSMIDGNVEENPIITAIYKELNVSKTQLTKEHFLTMLPVQIITLTDNMMTDMVFSDIEQQNLPISDRDFTSFPQFLYDNAIMQYGFQSIAIKVLMQLVNGLKKMTVDVPYGNRLAQTLGLSGTKLREDEINVILYSHTFFKLC